MIVFCKNDLPEVKIEWHIYKGKESQQEDFTRAQLWLWLVSDKDKVLLSATAEDGVIKAQFDSSMTELNLKEGAYSLKALWVKNRERCELRGEMGGQLRMAEIRQAFGITVHEEDATPISGASVVLRMKSMVSSYGYDGLSAYEIAVMRKVTTALSETEYVQMRASYVDTNQIADGAITAEKISDGSITNEKIADEAVTGDKIADGAITADKIHGDGITAGNIADGAITADKIADGAVTNEKIASNTIDSDCLHPNAVTTDKIADGGIDSLCIAKGAVTEDKIADGAVTEDKIKQSAVTSGKIADGAITNEKIGDGEITHYAIENKTITYEKIADGAITEDKIADGALKDFETKTSQRLAEVLARTVYLTQAEYDALIESGDVQDDVEYNILED